jgi:hypothetical protein
MPKVSASKIDDLLIPALTKLYVQTTAGSIYGKTAEELFRIFITEKVDDLQAHVLHCAILPTPSRYQEAGGPIMTAIYRAILFMFSSASFPAW